MSAFLLDSELEQDLKDARLYSEQWHEFFSEYERLASNLPSPDLPAHYPKVTDGGLAAFMSETSMRIWGQLQTGKVVQLPTDDQDYPEWKAELVRIIWENRIVKNANTMAPFFTKLQVTEHQAYYYGGKPVFVFPVSNTRYSGADFIPVRPQDVLIPSGYVSDLDAPRLWYVRRYDKIQLRGVIEAAKKAPGNNGWDVAKLEEIYNSNAFEERTEGQAYQEEDKAKLGQKVSFATCYQRGYKVPWITVYPKGNNDNHNIVRREENYFLDGEVPILFRYNQQDFINPYGISQVELAGPSQNVVDLFTSGHTYSALQAIDPPMKVGGDVNNDENLDLSTLVMSPANLMFTGNAEVEWFTPDKSILDQFPAMISSYKTNVQNLQGTTDASISGSSSGSSLFSKTPAGVNYQRERTSTKDNYHRNNADGFLSRLAKLLIATTLQLTEGVDIIKITEEQRDKLVAAGYEVPEDKLRIIAEFEELKDGEFEFDVDAGTSEREDDEATKQSIASAVETTMNMPDLDSRLAKEGKKFNLGVLLANYYDKSGLDNVDKIITDLDPNEQQQQNDTEVVQQEQAAAAVEQVRAQQEEEKLAQEQLKTQAQAAKTAEAISPAATETEQPASGAESDDELVTARLRAEGWSDEQISEYLMRVKEA